MVTPKKTEDGELKSLQSIISKKTDILSGETKEVNLNDIKSKFKLELKVSLPREPVVVLPRENAISVGKGISRKIESLPRETTVVAVPSQTKNGKSIPGQIANPPRERIVPVPLETKRSSGDFKKKVRFSICKMDTDTNFKVTLSIKKEADGCPVFYKVDGNRFKKEKTIKLMVETPYRVDFCFKPTQAMTQVSFRGQESETTERSYDSIVSAYSARLCVQDMPHSQRGHREDLDMRVQLKGGLTLQAVLQVKYYKAGDSQHCEWGSTFHCCELDCETHTDAGLVSILKETFR